MSAHSDTADVRALKGAQKDSRRSAGQTQINIHTRKSRRAYRKDEKLLSLGRVFSNVSYSCGDSGRGWCKPLGVDTTIHE